MLVESLVFSQLTFAFPVWGPEVLQNTLSRRNWLHNRAVHIVSVLCKLCITCIYTLPSYWLPFCALRDMLDQYAN